MKNFETILNTGEDAANYIQIDNPTNIFVLSPETVPVQSPDEKAVPIPR